MEEETSGGVVREFNELLRKRLRCCTAAPAFLLSLSFILSVQYFRRFLYLLVLKLLVLNLDLNCTREQDCNRVRRSCPLQSHRSQVLLCSGSPVLTIRASASKSLTRKTIPR